MTNPPIKVIIGFGHVTHEGKVNVANAQVDTLDKDDLVEILLIAAKEVANRVVDDCIEDTRRETFNA